MSLVEVELTPRVDACIADIMARHPLQASCSQSRHHDALHQAVSMLARQLERETRCLQAKLSACQAQLDVRAAHESRHARTTTPVPRPPSLKVPLASVVTDVDAGVALDALRIEEIALVRQHQAGDVQISTLADFESVYLEEYPATPAHACVANHLQPHVICRQTLIEGRWKDAFTELWYVDTQRISPQGLVSQRDLIKVLMASGHALLDPNTLVAWR